MIRAPADALALFRSGALPRMELGLDVVTVEAAAQCVCALCATGDGEAALELLTPLLALPVTDDGVPTALRPDGELQSAGTPEGRLRALLWVGLAAALTPGVDEDRRETYAEVAARRTASAPVAVRAPKRWDEFDYDDGVLYDEGTEWVWLLRETAIAGLLLLARPTAAHLAARAAEHLARYFRPTDRLKRYATCVSDRRAAFALDAEGYALAGTLFSALNTQPHPEELGASAEALGTAEWGVVSLVSGYPGVTGNVCPRATAMVAAASVARHDVGLGRAILTGLAGRIDPTQRVVRNGRDADLPGTLLWHAALTGQLFTGAAHAQ